MHKHSKTSVLFLFLITLITLLISINFSSAAPSRPILSIVSYEANSGSLSTGDSPFDLDLKLKNTGDLCAQDVTFTVQLSSPFLIDKSLTSNSAQICSGIQDTITLSLKLQNDVVGGTYPLTLTVNYKDPSGNVYSLTNTLTIFIEGNSEINAHIVNSMPLKIYPGDTATISVNIENDGTFQAQSIKGVFSADSPLTVIPEQSFFSIGSLQPKQSVTEQFSVEIPKDAQAQSYPINLGLDYTENGDSKTKNINLLLNIEKKASFEASSPSTNTYYKNSEGKVVHLILKNTGTDTANEIKMQLQPQFPFTTDGSIRYLNSLAPGESQPVEFVINIDKLATPGSYSLDLILDFKDEQGNSLQDSTTAQVTISQESIFQIIFINYWFLWFLVEILVIIFLLRAFTQRNKKGP